MSKDFESISMKKAGSNKYVHNFSAHHNTIDTSNSMNSL